LRDFQNEVNNTSIDVNNYWIYFLTDLAWEKIIWN
jgi:hypothetical protein